MLECVAEFMVVRTSQLHKHLELGLEQTSIFGLEPHLRIVIGVSAPTHWRSFLSAVTFVSRFSCLASSW